MPFFDIFASPRWSPLRMRTKVVSFVIFFPRAFKQTKKIKALRPKMTKIASRGSCLKGWRWKGGGGGNKPVKTTHELDGSRESWSTKKANFTAGFEPVTVAPYQNETHRRQHLSQVHRANPAVRPFSNFLWSNPERPSFPPLSKYFFYLRLCRSVYIEKKMCGHKHG